MSPQFSGPAEIVRKYLAKHNQTVQAAAFGLPGAVVDGRVQTTNLPWVVDSRHLAAELGADSVELINDLFANAYGIALLQETDFVVLNQGTPSSTGNGALISAGTGLGEADLLADDGGFRPFPSEGGHTDFASTNELQIELLRYLLGHFEHVSYERVLSGPGLHTGAVWQSHFNRETRRLKTQPDLPGCGWTNRRPAKAASENRSSN